MKAQTDLRYPPVYNPVGKERIEIKARSALCGIECTLAGPLPFPISKRFQASGAITLPTKRPLSPLLCQRLDFACRSAMIEIPNGRSSNKMNHHPF